MTHAYPAPGLPDPAREAAFYEGVAVKRAFAFAVDFALIFVLALVILPFTAFAALFFFPFFIGVVGFFYRWATLASGSATWGMRLMAIEIRERDGLRLSAATAFLHVAGLYLSFAVFPVQIVSAVMMVALGRGQGLTDLLLGTAAINRPA
jgi:uncharacterized RDD family membrane protein YckC